MAKIYHFLALDINNRSRVISVDQIRPGFKAICPYCYDTVTMIDSIDNKCLYFRHDHGECRFGREFGVALYLITVKKSVIFTYKNYNARCEFTGKYEIFHADDGIPILTAETVKGVWVNLLVFTSPQNYGAYLKKAPELQNINCLPTLEIDCYKGAVKSWKELQYRLDFSYEKSKLYLGGQTNE